MTTYAIGDLQGCHGSLMALLERIHAETPDPRLIFVGDLVNRGPASLATVRTIQSFGDKAVALLGNHDLHLLAVANGIRRAHASDTLDEILQSPEREEWLDWLRNRPLAHYEDGYLMVHAGVLPQWTTQQTLALAGEVEAVLRSDDWIDFLRQMYGNFPAKWDDALTGADRIRCIVNALTRLRFCTPDGTMELTTKEAHGANLPGHLPWFEAPERQTADTTIVFGHWSTRGLVREQNVIGLDTGCIWGGKLTALRLSDRGILQTECPKSQQPG